MGLNAVGASIGRFCYIPAPRLGVARKLIRINATQPPQQAREL